ncbi:MAG: PQQ-dependent sugar dehydrogenase [Clostridiales bacterium]|nr:PQQ-dependent sugar dehydrogenase [Clostridiales bacterium]
MKKNKLLFLLVFIILVGLLWINFFKNNRQDKLFLTEEVELLDGYTFKKEVQDLNESTAFTVDSEGNIYIAETISGEVVINKYLKNGKNEIVAKGFNYPITSMLIYKDSLIVSHKGKITKISSKGREDLITGLPSFGDYSNNGIQIGYDGHLYICQGSATNSGVVGLDNFENGWLKDNPYFHDYYPVDVVLSGINFKSSNPLTEDKNDRATTGAFMPFNMESSKETIVKGKTPGNASIYRTYIGSGKLELFAYGIRNPINMVFTHDNKVYVAVQGMENRGQRPIANGSDYIYEIKKGDWLGWPDYEGGEPVTLKKFKPKNASQPQFITQMHPTTTPVKPLVAFAESGRIGAMDISRQNAFGYVGNLFIPLKQTENNEAKIVMYDIKGNVASDFIKNKSKNILKEPVQCSFSNDGKLYILDKGSRSLYCVEKVEESNPITNKIYIPVEYLIGTLVISLIVILVIQFRKR